MDSHKVSFRNEYDKTMDEVLLVLGFISQIEDDLSLLKTLSHPEIKKLNQDLEGLEKDKKRYDSNERILLWSQASCYQSGIIYCIPAKLKYEGERYDDMSDVERYVKTVLNEKWMLSDNKGWDEDHKPQAGIYQATYHSPGNVDTKVKVKITRMKNKFERNLKRKEQLEDSIQRKKQEILYCESKRTDGKIRDAANNRLRENKENLNKLGSDWYEKLTKLKNSHHIHEKDKDLAEDLFKKRHFLVEMGFVRVSDDKKEHGENRFFSARRPHDYSSHARRAKKEHLEKETVSTFGLFSRGIIGVIVAGAFCGAVYGGWRYFKK